MQSVLVTGGAGFIGSNFVRYLLKSDAEVRVVNLDALTYAGSLENLTDLRPGNASERHTFVKGDIRDRELLERLLREHRIDTIVHFAAETHVDRSILDPASFVQTNVIGTLTLLEAARKIWLDGTPSSGAQFRFHHVSTDEVYGSLAPDEPAWSETASYAPNSPYAASKAASDHLVRAYGHTYRLPYTLSNCSNNYGPRQFPEKLIPLMILNALSGKPLPVYGDGQQIRDWLFVDDLCEAIHLILTKGRLGETYNIGGGNQPANLTIVETLCDILDEVRPGLAHHDLIAFVPDRPGHDRRYELDITRMRRDLGWSPRHSLTDGLLETVRWYLDHPAWIQAIRQQPDYETWLDKNYTNREART
jgi:dTDP-glucose 4,6-dehydratase